MKKVFFLSYFVLFLNICIGHSQEKVNFLKELSYGVPRDTTLPTWVQKMYANKPNVGEVIELYNNYYKTNPFVKNEHTQFYKRWIKNTSQIVDSEGFINPPSKEDVDRIFQERMRNNMINNGNRSTNSQPAWVPIGPFDFDKDAAGRSHAPGAAHVYTIEKASSNPDILYCGTANAGVWKTIDRGLNWTYVSASIPVNYCNGLEIHPTDPNTVWISGNDRIYKTINGGNTWTVMGDAAFQALAIESRDIALKPGNSNILFVASDKGLFRSLDGGATFTKLLNPKSVDSYFGEIEFKPNDPNTMYVLLNGVNDVYTELYKSVDGGNTFAIVFSWPVLLFGGDLNYNYIGKSVGTNQYATFSNDNLGTNTIPDFTIEMRVKLPAAYTDQTFLSNKNWNSGSNNGWFLGCKWSGDLLFNIGNGSNRIDLNTSGIWDDNWHQVSVVYRSTGLKELYVDGIQKATSTTNITLNSNTGLPMVLGRDGNLGYGALNLQVDEFRLWNTALNNTAINNWAFNELDNSHPNNANLLHYYKCNEPGGLVITDEKMTNNGAMNVIWDRSSAIAHVSTTNLPFGDHQKRGEIAVTAANPNKVYALLAGSSYGGTGLYGFYESLDEGVTWTHKCCGSGPGGSASSSNQNLLGYSSTGVENGGQYYYDLALDADPANPNKVHIAGINPWISLNSGTTFANVGHWSNPSGVGYVHADVHNIKIYGNEVWTVSDGGIFMSQDSGKVVFNKRQYGITGTDFWGFGMGHKDANVMLGGTYHNSHLMKNNDVYINGWISYTGSADGTRGFVNPGKNKVVYNDGGRQLLPPVRTTSPTDLPFSKVPNTGDITSKVTWDPRCYNCTYTGNLTGLWYSTNDGQKWDLVYDFSPYNVGDIEIAWDNPNIIWVTGMNPSDFYGPKKIWRSIDRGLTWVDMTPSFSALGYNSSMWYNITLSDNSQNMWMNVFHRYGWNSSNNNKIFYSTNSGTSWTLVPSAMLNNQNIEDVVYQRGSNGGIYVGTNKSVYYKDNTLSSFVPFSTGLPLNIGTTRLFPWYKEGKIRLGSNQSVWESPLHTIGSPQAMPMVDKLSSICGRDTFYFGDYSAHYKTGATFAWTITPSPSYISSLSVENPKVVFGNAGVFTVSLTVTDSVGTSTRNILGGITVTNTGCGLDTIPGKSMLSAANGDYAAQEKAMNFSSNNVTLTAWIKPTAVTSDIYGLVFCRGGSTLATGLHLSNNGGQNELRYHWADGQYGFSSGLIVPTNQWSHVALVITPTQARLYVNGKLATHNATLNPVNFLNPFHIGVDPSSNGRTFRGQMDEVCIYNRALSTEEVRELMHLTKDPSLDPALLAYYQLNSPSATIDYDKVGNNNLSMNGASSKIESTAPVGKGVSQTISVTNGGLKDFNIPGIKMYFSTSAPTYPAGDVVVSRINQLPDTFPIGGILPKAYWVINNYGTNQTFTTLDSINFINSGNIAGGCDQRMYEMYSRTFNGEGVTWGGAQDVSERFNPNPPSHVVFKDDNNVTTFGQFYIRNENSPSSDPEICNGIDDNCNGLIDESYDLNVTVKTDDGVGSLRQILRCAQNGDVIRFESAVDTIMLLSKLEINKNVTLLDDLGAHVVIKMNLNQPGFANAEAGCIIQPAYVRLENIDFLHTNNSNTKPALMNFGSLTMKNNILMGNPKTIISHSPGSSYLVEGQVLIK